MSNFPNMDGLDLFTAPFASPQNVKPKVSAQQPKSAIPQTQQPNIQQKPVPVEKPPALQKEQEKAVKQRAEASTKAEAKAQPEPPKTELTMDMSDHTIPAGKHLDSSEDARRKTHEEAEAKRKAEWDAKQAAKKQAEEAAVQKLQAMSDADIISASTERVRTDVERLTRRNMKECVAEHIQKLCCKDPAFARKTMHPKKSMIHCFKYINRMAKDYIRQEMEDNDAKPENGVYGGDVPDGLCYQWAENYFNDPDAEEDKEKEEKFVSRPYSGTASKSKKATKAKDAKKKEAEKKPKPENNYEQMSFTEVL